MDQQKKEDLEATSFRGGIEDKEIELESLIKEALLESKRLANAEKVVEKSGEEAAFRATPMKKATEEPLGAAEEKAAQKKEEATSYDETFKKYKIGDIVKGKVVKIDPIGVLVDIGYKAEGLIPPEELSDKSFSNISDVVSVGDEVSVAIDNLENKEGYVVLSKRRADYENKWKAAYDAYKGRKVLEARVTGAVKGGLVVDFDGIRGFIPASQVAKKSEDQLEEFVGKTLPIKIMELDRRQGRVVLSHKLAADEKQRFESDKVINDLEVGQVRKGVVSSIKSFGAFVDLGGIEGLIHLTELSWKRVSHPSEVLKVGDEIDVFVLGVDRINRKVSLGLKELQPDPWVEATQLYGVGQIVKGKVARLVKFGAFIELEKGLEGLCHISELSAKPVARPEDAVKPGDQVTVKILRVLPEEQKIGLSIKEVQMEEEKQRAKAEQEEKTKVTIEDVLKEKTEKK